MQSKFNLLCNFVHTIVKSIFSVDLLIFPCLKIFRQLQNSDDDDREAGALGSRYSLHLNARVNHSFQVKNLLKLVRKLYFMLREASFVQVINCNHNFL